MSLPKLKHPGYNIEDWKTLEGRWDLIKGVPYDIAPAPSVEHQRVSVRMIAALFNALEDAKRKHDGGDCEAFHAPIDLFLPEEAAHYVGLVR